MTHGPQKPPVPLSPGGADRTLPAPPGKGGRPLREDMEFLPDASAAMLEEAPRGGRLILWAVFAFLVAGAIWASRAQLDEITRGMGKVIPSSQLQVVQNLEGGIVSEILANEGDVVSKGQVLLRIDDVRFASSYRENKTRYQAFQAKAARLRAEAEDKPFSVPEDLTEDQPNIVAGERDLYDSRQEQLKTSVGILQDQTRQKEQELTELKSKRAQYYRGYTLAKQELDLSKPLVSQGAVSEVEVLRLERQVNELWGQLQATRLAIPRVESQLAESKRKVEETRLAFFNEARTELNDTLAQLAQLSESNLALEDRVKRTQVRAPLRGEVKRLLVNTVGGVVQPGMDLMEIVPLDDSLMVEARVSPRDIGFLRPGQDAKVKFTAYDFAIYGGLEGKLVLISPDSITDEQGETYYQVRVRTERNYLGTQDKPMPIIPGMQASVDILTGKKTVLEYLLKPLLRARELALRER